MNAQYILTGIDPARPLQQVILHRKCSNLYSLRSPHVCWHCLISMDLRYSPRTDHELFLHSPSNLSPNQRMQNGHGHRIRTRMKTKNAESLNFSCQETLPCSIESGWEISERPGPWTRLRQRYYVLERRARVWSTMLPTNRRFSCSSHC